MRSLKGNFQRGYFESAPHSLLGTITYCISANSFESYPSLYNSYVAMSDFPPTPPWNYLSSFITVPVKLFAEPTFLDSISLEVCS